MSRNASIRRQVVDAMKIHSCWVEITAPDGLTYTAHRISGKWHAVRNQQWVIAEDGVRVTAPNARECCEHLWRAALRRCATGEDG